jgi:hypothetical protein
VSERARKLDVGDAAAYVGLLRQLHGPCGSELLADVGPMARELYDALRVRAASTVDSMAPDANWEPDIVDLAATRVLFASVLRRCHESQLSADFGCGFDQAQALDAEAAKRLRTLGIPGWGSLTVWIGDHVFEFPRKIVRGSDGPVGDVVAIPSQASWNAVFPDCDRWRISRTEALDALSAQIGGDASVRLEEMSAISYWDLEQGATRRARELSGSPQEP